MKFLKGGTNDSNCLLLSNRFLIIELERGRSLERSAFNNDSNCLLVSNRFLIYELERGRSLENSAFRLIVGTLISSYSVNRSTVNSLNTTPRLVAG
jgi:hypothetical protein